MMKSIYDFTIEKVNGDEISMKEYEGKVLMIVNSATRCGFTPQYDEMQDLYEKYADAGFEILEFPCNQFGEQAPESDEEIITFCDVNFGITFKHFAKVEVNGENAHPMFKYLQEEKEFKGFDEEHPLTETLIAVLGKDYEKDSSIKWNFTKFIIGREGKVVERFEPTTDMFDVEMCIKELL